ncbi:MAG: chemotaxis protein CheW [Gemmatimonas sp.]
MTAPRFRSTAAFTMRHRQAAPIIDRATFVIFSLDGQRYAAPAESVERVLRQTPSGEHGARVVEHAGQQVPIIDFRAALGGATSSRASEAGSAPDVRPAAGQRTLVFSVQDVWIAATVDAVYEVATIDAALVRPLEPVVAFSESTMPRAVRGRFVRHDQEVQVLDMLRVVRAVYEATHHATDVNRSRASATSS